MTPAPADGRRAFEAESVPVGIDGRDPGGVELAHLRCRLGDAVGPQDVVVEAVPDVHVVAAVVVGRVLEDETASEGEGFAGPAELDHGGERVLDGVEHRPRTRT
ncbi:hypothetical protein OHB21_21385 [Nocardia puris]|nr:hypothetical protein [Nocardia puris]